MCVVFFGLSENSEYPFLIAANRDEFFERPTQKAEEWPDLPGLYAGKDLTQGGTWLGVTKTGRVALVTNIRAPGVSQQGKLSRGRLPIDFLKSHQSPKEFLDALKAKAADYNPFNLIVGTTRELMAFHSLSGKSALISQGVHGISNGKLNEPWPKVEQGKKDFSKIIRANSPEFADHLLDLMQDTTPYPEKDLPKTGVSPAVERALSPVFIRLSVPKPYGTRSTTLLLGDRHGRMTFLEQTYGEDGSLSQTSFSFAIQRA